MQQNIYDCPRCGGTGVFTLRHMEGETDPDRMFECTTRCRPCGGEGLMTRELWEQWGDHLNGKQRRATEEESTP